MRLHQTAVFTHHNPTMDDGLELNFAAPSGDGLRRQLAPKKGGRWTDRYVQLNLYAQLMAV